MMLAFTIITCILLLFSLMAALVDEFKAVGAAFLLWVVSCAIFGFISLINPEETNEQKASEEIKNAISQEIAEAYYEGQRDYAEGNVHIRDINYDHCYHWETTPWNDVNIDSIPYVPECVIKKDIDNGTR